MRSQADRAADSGLSAGVLSEILRDNNVFIGGSSMGKGFRRAARYYLRKEAPKAVANDKKGTLDFGALNDGVEFRVEDPFYVVDLGVLISQFHQWRKHFPRVQPFYAVKCNPDPVMVKLLASLGCNFDCASRSEIRLVQSVCAVLPEPFNTPEIIYANPTKARSHVIEAVCRGVTLVTFDNITEVKKCAQVSSNIQLVLRIITDDSGSQCRLSTKYGAPKSLWRALLSAAKKHGLEVVGVSFHVGSGCRNASRYEMALRDAREAFDLAQSEEFGFNMRLLDIGGGFPGETHSLYNPSTVFGDPTAPWRNRKYTIDEEIDDEDDDNDEEGYEPGEGRKGEDPEELYFDEIADSVVRILDELFPQSSGVKIIAEPGRYLVAASSTLVTSIVSVRSNVVDPTVPETIFSDREAAHNVDQITRAEEDIIVKEQGKRENEAVDSLLEELSGYSRLYARRNLSQQEVDVYTEKADWTAGAKQKATSLLAPPEAEATERYHTVEGMQMGIVADCYDDTESIASKGEVVSNRLVSSLAAAGEAAVSGLVIQAVTDSSNIQDDYSYYINDGVYGAFNNLLFDHATVRPRYLRHAISKKHRIIETKTADGLKCIEAVEDVSDDESESTHKSDKVDDSLLPSTVFGPTCDSMDVISRSVLLPKLTIGDWLYFQNMGAYTSAAASTFNGFSPTEKFYVCSIHPENFPEVLQGAKGAKITGEEKKDELIESA